MPSQEPIDFCLPLSEGDCYRSSSVRIKIHQADDDDDASEEDSSAAADLMHDTGFMMWPSAVMLSRYITQHPHLVWDCSGDILEIGAGCGLVGLTAAALLKQGRSNTDEGEHLDDDDDNEDTTTVIMTDYNPAARDNLERNAILNEVTGHTSVAGLDFFDQKPPSYDGVDRTEGEDASWIDMDGNFQPQVPLIFGADVIAYSNDSEMVANVIQAALLEGGKAIVMGPSSSQRFGLEGFEDCCLGVGLTVAVSEIEAGQTTFEGAAGHDGGVVEEQEEQQDLACELEQRGVVTGNGYDFVMYTIGKPIKAM